MSSADLDVRISMDASPALRTLYRLQRDLIIDRLTASLRQAYDQNRTPVRWILGRILARSLCAEHGLPVESIRMILGLPVEISDVPVGWTLVAK